MNVLRHVPNSISAARIVAPPILIYLAFTGREDLYKWLLLAALPSDIADGLVARTFSVILTPLAQALMRLAYSS